MRTQTKKERGSKREWGGAVHVLDKMIFALGL